MKTKAIFSVMVLLAVYWTLTTVHCFSVVPSLINYQGMLKDSSGVPYHGNATMVFSIWNDSTGGNKLWEETQAIVTVSHGLFNVLLGSSVPVPDTAFLKPNTWLQVIANGNQLSPRKRIVSVGYAFHSKYADTAGYALSAPPDDDWMIDTSGFNIFRMTGNVGIGTTSPSVKLEVQSVGCEECTVVKLGDYGATHRQYLQIDVENSDPPASACDEGSEVGRMVIRGDTNTLFICTVSPTIGWKRLVGQ